MDTQELKNHLDGLFHKRISLISTIDHPFASPPTRMLDGHHKLRMLEEHSGESVGILLWDVSFPIEKRYRTDMIFDSGLLSGRTDKTIIFNSNDYFFNQKPHVVREDQQTIRKILGLVANEYRISEDQQENMVRRYRELLAVYRHSSENASDGIEFYIRLLPGIYDLFHETELGTFFRHSVCSYYHLLMRDWIPLVMTAFADTPYAFSDLLSTDMFERQLFRLSSGKNYDDEKYDTSHQSFDDIVASLRAGDAIPSDEVFFWALYVTDIRHYGNDHGFLEKLNRYYTQKGLAKKALQMTEPGADSNAVIKIDDDYSYQEQAEGKLKKSVSTKISRLHTLPAGYVLDGDGIITRMNEILHGQEYIVKL